MVQLIFSAKNIALKANAVPFLVPTLSTTELLEQDSALFFFGLPNFGFTYSELFFFAKAIPSFWPKEEEEVEDDLYDIL